MSIQPRRSAHPAARRLAPVSATRIGVVPGWPATRLDEPDLPRPGRPLDDLPVGLRRDLEEYLARLATVRRNIRGKRVRPSKPSTIRTRRAEVLAFLGKVVECGFALETLTTLAKALKPEVVATVLDSYCQRNGAVPSVYTIDLAGNFLPLQEQRAERCRPRTATRLICPGTTPAIV